MTSGAAVLPRVPVSVGELLDKITILRIKREKIASGEGARHVADELSLLEGVATSLDLPDLGTLETDLGAVNRRLWDIEDEIRELERSGDFGARFIEVARSVYRFNDWRAALKREINAAAGSRLMEVKHYAGA